MDRIVDGTVRDDCRQFSHDLRASGNAFNQASGGNRVRPGPGGPRTRPFVPGLLKRIEPMGIMAGQPTQEGKA